MFSFIPHARRRVPPNPTTDYRGGWVTTTNPLNPTKADAIAATQLFEATKWAALFEGLDLEFSEGGSLWSLAAAATEGFNPFEHAAQYNGVAFDIEWSWVGQPSNSASEVLQRFGSIPATEDVRIGRDEVVLPGHPHRIEVSPGTVRDGSAGPSVRYWSRTEPYFYQWLSRQAVPRAGGGTRPDVARFRDAAVGEAVHRDRNPYRLIWRLADRDILERTWYFTLGQGHRHPIDALAIGTRSAHGTIVTSPHTGDYHCADDGKVTPLDATTVRDCDSAFDDRHGPR
ncbi:hypothetical protein [Gordonia soli]|uniref:Uncharacterized protein n=1 Tax=Gordonia soli NBRC 108243 TaxID=1223545 RepID=M0QLN3_9ACTN|nr:hypothetical protein [Gordonia soli]GAC69324.1 hypothetical protein GS4_23_01210 [Gordonia soli NBRC 108243]